MWPPVRPPDDLRPSRQARFVFGAQISADWGYTDLPLGNVHFSNGMRSASGADLQYVALRGAPLYAGLVAELPYLFVATGASWLLAGTATYVEWRTVVAPAMRYRFVLASLGPALRVWQLDAPLFLAGTSAAYSWRAPIMVDLALEARIELNMPNRCRAHPHCYYVSYALTGGLPVTGVGAYYLAFSTVIGGGLR